jgi:hypothetical protein
MSDDLDDDPEDDPVADENDGAFLFAAPGEESDWDDPESKLGDLESITDDHESKIDDLESEVEDLITSITALESQVKELENAIEGGAILIKVLYGYLLPAWALGMAVSVALSWQRNHSTLWALFHGVISWFYLFYYWITTITNR